MKNIVNWTFLGIALTVTCAAFPERKEPEPQLHIKRSFALPRFQGKIDQLIELPDGNFLIRDSTYIPLTAQKIMVYSPAGTLIRSIGSYGPKPGQFSALKQIEYDPKAHTIWVVDMMGRLSWFTTSGDFIGSVVIQRPGFHPYGVAIDEDNHTYLLSGCVAQKFYLDQGCRMIHQYEMETNKYVRSFGENDPDAVTNRYFGLEDYLLAQGPSGLYAVDAPVRKLLRFATNGSSTAFPIPVDTAKAIPSIDPTLPASEIGRGMYVANRLLLTTKYVILSLERKGSEDHILEIYSLSGKLLARDLTSPGSLVGVSGRDTLWFAKRGPGGVVLNEYDVAKS